MADIFRMLKWPSIISSVLVLPFMLMEWLNRRGFNEDFPVVLFGLMWLLPLAFILLLKPITHSLGEVNSLMRKPGWLVIRVFLSILIAGVWINLILDQLPCFLGVTNCD